MKDSRTTTIPIMAAAVMTTNNNTNKGKKKKKRINTSSTTGSSSSMLTTITVIVVGLLRRNYILLFLLVLAIIQNIYLLSSLSKATNFKNDRDSAATVVLNNNAIGVELAKENFYIQQQQRSTTSTTTDNNGDNNSDNNGDGDDVLEEEEDEEFRIEEENNNKNKNRKGRKRRREKDDNKEEDDSVNKLLLYELWNHTTNTIHIPNALRPSFANTGAQRGSNGSSPDDKHQVLLTSLEILQNVLHNTEKEREYLAVDNYIQRNFSLSITETIPQCLIPNKDATRQLANEYRKLKFVQPPPQHPNANANLFPVLNVGMPKMGTTTLADYFDCAGYYATHDKVGNKYFGKNQHYIRTQNTGPQKGDIHEGVELFRRAKKMHSGTNGTLFKLLDYNKERVNKSIDVHCQMDTNRVEGWYPQIKLLDELHEEQPNSTFVLIFRPLKDWFNSINHWPGIKERMSKFTMPGLVLTKQQQIDVQKVRNWHSNAKEFSFLSKSSKEEFIQQYKKQNPELYRLKIIKDAKNAAKRAAKMKKKNQKNSKSSRSEKNIDDEPTLLYPILKPSEPEPVNEIQLGRWWCSHVNHIRDYVKQYPSHKLIELDLYDTKTSSEVLDDIFQKHKKHEDEDSSNGNEKRESCWGHANVNKKAATTT